MGSGRCGGFRHNSTPVHPRSKGPSVPLPSTSVLKEARKPITLTAGPLPYCMEERTGNLCALQASKTIIAGGKERGFSLFLPTFQSSKLLPSIAAEIAQTIFFSVQNIYSTVL